jgi:predicted phosphodiesterase
MDRPSVGRIPLRLLLMSDTHGRLDLIQELVERTRADAVVHAGDFGIYDRDSVGRLSRRELLLRVVHSGLSKEEKRRVAALSEGELRDYIQEFLPLSDLPHYLEGERVLPVPVHAVWGNHEDRVVIEKLLAGELSVPNLYLLDERHSPLLGPIRLLGLGGNVLAGRKIFDRPLGGGGGKVWTTLVQIGRLLEAAEALPEGEFRVLVTHVSPGKEPIIARLAAHLGVRMTVSGHMGSPYCNVWNEFTVREPEDSRVWVDGHREALEQAAEKYRDRHPELQQTIERGLDALLHEPAVPEIKRRYGSEPAWYRGIHHVNLPDAPDGYALLENRDGHLALETTSRGRLLSV